MPLDKCPKCIETGFFGMHIRMYKMFTFFLFWLLNHLCNLHVLLNLALWCTSVTHFNNIFQQHNIMLCIFHYLKKPPSTWLVRTRYRPMFQIRFRNYHQIGRTHCSVYKLLSKANLFKYNLTQYKHGRRSPEQVKMNHYYYDYWSM